MEGLLHEIGLIYIIAYPLQSSQWAAEVRSDFCWQPDFNQQVSGEEHMWLVSKRTHRTKS